MSKSFATIKRGQAILTSLDVTGTLSKEQIELAKLLAEETKHDFDFFLSLIETICDFFLPGYQGIEKLTFFRSHIRDRLMNEFIDYEESLDHAETINDARHAGCP